MQLMQGVQNWATLPYAGPWSIVTVFCRQGKCLGGRAAGFAQEACFIFRKHSYALAPSELRGKGIVSMKDSSVHGDQYVTIQIEVPRNLSPQARQKLKEFEEICQGSSRTA